MTAWCLWVPLAPVCTLPLSLAVLRVAVYPVAAALLSAA